jgi:hypothetical protein
MSPAGSPRVSAPPAQFPEQFDIVSPSHVQGPFLVASTSDPEPIQCSGSSAAGGELAQEVPTTPVHNPDANQLNVDNSNSANAPQPPRTRLQGGIR